MKFKLDENLPASSAAILAGAGHDVDSVAGEVWSEHLILMLPPQPPQPDGS